VSRPQPETLTVTSSDGETVSARVFEPAKAPREALLFMPAMGAAARTYDRFGTELARLGVGVLTGDHRGTGSSTLTARRGVDFGYADLLERDWPALIAAARARFPGARLHLGGHSLGAHLASLYLGRAPGDGASLVIVAAGSVDFRGWTYPARLKILGGTQAALGIALALGFFPGDRLGFGGRQPLTLITDWARIARTGRFALRDSTVDGDAALGTVDKPILWVHVEGDTLAPRGSTARLLAKMPKAQVTRAAVDSPTGPSHLDPHFRWMREPKSVAEAVERALTQV
jgi:predicted alpha/beta hydrolase